MTWFSGIGLDSASLTENSDEGSAASSLWKAIRACGENRRVVFSAGIIGLMALFSFVGPLIYHTNLVDTNLAQATLPPSGHHPLGTNEQGFDVLGELMKGGQSSLEVGLSAAALASVIGTVWGAVAGYVGGWLDAFMMRIVDSMLAVPSLLMVMLLGSIYIPTIPVMIVILGILSWLVTARLIRGEALTLRMREYVQASRVFGSRNWRIVLRHIVPNVFGTIAVQTTFQVADAMLLLAALSYLGLGPPPPAVSWGGLLSDGLNYIYQGYWWLIYPPGIAIVLTVVAFNFMGDGLRDSLDIRLRSKGIT
jgi:peptide/nickel transport system permease protein